MNREILKRARVISNGGTEANASNDVARLRCRWRWGGGDASSLECGGDALVAGLESLPTDLW